MGIYHGSGKKKSVANLGTFDVVLATPGTSLFIEGEMIKYISSFTRLIIDECHQRETWWPDLRRTH